MTTYVVRGDTLTSIAERYGATVQALVQEKQTRFNHGVLTNARSVRWEHARWNK